MLLYEIPQETEKAFSKYLECFDQETGEQTASDEDTEAAYLALTELQNRRDELAEWALKKRANSEARIAMLEQEAKRMLDACAKEARSVLRMEKIIGSFFPPEETVKPVTIGTFSVSYRSSSAVEIVDQSMIPSEFMKSPKIPEPSPDKTAIKQAIKEGKEVPGARIEERKNLQVK